MTVSTEAVVGDMPASLVPFGVLPGFCRTINVNLNVSSSSFCKRTRKEGVVFDDVVSGSFPTLVNRICLKTPSLTHHNIFYGRVFTDVSPRKIFCSRECIGCEDHLGTASRTCYHQ
jgi:hypothetical protein